MSTTIQKQKGPAEVGASPSHGSQPLGRTLNMDTNTIAAPARQARPQKPTPDAVASAMREMEDDIHSLGHMAHILAEMLDSNLSEPGPNGRISMPKKGDVLKVHLTYSQMEKLSFVWNNVANRAWKLRDRFNAACDGEVAS